MGKVRSFEDITLSNYAEAVRRENAAKHALGAAHEEDNRARLARQEAWRQVKRQNLDPGFYAIDSTEGVLITTGDYPDLVSIRH